MPHKSTVLNLFWAVLLLAPACRGGHLKDQVDAGPGGAPPSPDGGPPPGNNPPPPPPPSGAARTIPTNGSAVAITKDDKWAVAANRTAGRVTVFKLDFGGLTMATKSVDLDVGKNAEPWAVVIGNDDDSAYAILRRDQQVVKIRNLRSGASVDPMRASTGSEPTGLAISPSGKTLYVANWADGTVTVIDSASLAVKRTVDLNAALAATPWLGAVAPRPGLAHPRAIVVTNNGDDNDGDETIYVTEFFSQARAAGVPTDDSQFDLARQGAVYPINVGTWEVGAPIQIPPIGDTGFPDSKGQVTGCFPNQLYAAALNSGRLYVTAVCESPRGPTGLDPAPVAPGVATSNFKTQVHGAIFVIDTATNKSIPQQAVLLTREFDKLFTSLNLPDDASRRIPLIPNDIMFAAGSTFGYVTGYGSDAVYRIAYKADGSLERVGAMAQPFINLKPGGNIANGELPVGIASANTGAAKLPFALAINENSRNLTVMSFATQTSVAAIPAADPPALGAETSANRGRKFFVTGQGRWSFNGQSWNACESCHPDGLTDNVTWFFARGPRQTISLDASYDPRTGKRRVLNWTGIFDEIHDFELNTRGNSGGVGAIVHRPGPPLAAADRIIFDGTMATGEQKLTATPQAGLNGSTVSLMPGGNGQLASVLNDWNDIDDYVKDIRSPRAPTGLDPAAVAEGKKLFDAAQCAACHGGSGWTIGQVFYTPGDENSGATGLLKSLEYTRPTNFPVSLNPPAASGRATLRFTGANPAANDQINCVLRDVGTFPSSGTAGVAPNGVTVKEVRQDMSTPAQGQSGYNIPSLLGGVTGAPYFHAGSARTLEEALGDAFDVHRRAFAENFRPDATQIRQLVSYLLSIDESTAPPPAPVLGFSFDLCAQIPAGALR
jgi:YVTN family beta-propeller protein